LKALLSPSPFVVNMKVFCWNIRGLNSRNRQRVVRSWIASNNLLVGCFLETHVAQENANSVLASTLPGWRMDSNYCCSELGRIWIVWDPSISVLVFKRTDQIMFCSIKIPSLLQSFAVAFVYGRNSELDRRSLWEDILVLSRTSPLSVTPWLLLGDFNQIAAASEHYSINQSLLNLRGMEDLQCCLRDSQLSDLPSRGVFFTWSNHQQDNPILRKLDRALANGEWFAVFPSALAVFDPPGDSDHAPCIILIDNQPPPSKKSFKYFSFLSSHPSYLAALSTAWEENTLVGSHMFSLRQHLKVAKLCCRTLNRLRFSNIQQRTAQSLTRLEDIQVELLTSPSDTLFRREHVARKQWIFFAAALESFFRQKSRIRWLHEGDANTRFFHRAVIAHQATNLIKFLRGDDGFRVENVDQIKGMLIAYYSHLLGIPSENVTPFSVEKIKGLLPFRCDSFLASQLTTIPSEEEITQVLFSMPRNKAPGPDGFPVEFFIEAWAIVKSSVVAAIREFFISGNLPRGFNATAITLIPKVTGADRLTQFALWLVALLFIRSLLASFPEG
jgi:mannosylglycoprotein endo-beta-mannosidase